MTIQLRFGLIGRGRCTYLLDIQQAFIQVIFYLDLLYILKLDRFLIIEAPFFHNF